MSHQEQLGFFSAVVAANPAVVDGGRVIEIGSYDVNGSMRALFAEASTYVGVDLQPGPGVDLVSFGHEVEAADSSYDLAVSGECFEHDPHWPDTLRTMTRLTRPGGLVAFTCASTGRPEHGTTRTLVSDSPGTQSQGIDYYRNLTREDVEAEVDLGSLFSAHRFWYLPTSMDLYFAGVVSGATAGAAAAALPADSDVQALRSLMPLVHRAVRIPLRVARRVVPEARYQSTILPYWLAMIRVQQRLNGEGRHA